MKNPWRGLWLITVLMWAWPSCAAAPATITNTVVVTNYVIVTITNQVFTTNFSFFAATPAPARKPTDLPPLDWVPPDDGFDWIQLKSGEWLKGHLKGMQGRELDFESEELDTRTFDWADIRQLRTARQVDLLFDDGRATNGPVTITPDLVKMRNDESATYPRALLFSMTPGGSRRSYWSGKASVGLTVRTGNSDQVEYNGQARLQRRTSGTRLSVDYIGNISSLDGKESANNHRLNSEFDVWLSRRLYLVAPFAEYYKDPFQNIAHRVTAGVGVGYDIVTTPRVEWNVNTGPAYQQVWFDSALPGEPTEKGNAALTFGSRLDWDITSRLSLILEYRGQYTSRKVGETTHHGVATVEVDITQQWDLDVSLVWDRISRPKADEAGVTPKPDDFRLVVGLGLEF